MFITRNIIIKSVVPQTHLARDQPFGAEIFFTKLTKSRIYFRLRRTVVICFPRMIPKIEEILPDEPVTNTAMLEIIRSRRGLVRSLKLSAQDCRCMLSVRGMNQ